MAELPAARVRLIFQPCVHAFRYDCAAGQTHFDSLRLAHLSRQNIATYNFHFHTRHRENQRKTTMSGIGEMRFVHVLAIFIGRDEQTREFCRFIARVSLVYLTDVFLSCLKASALFAAFVLRKFFRQIPQTQFGHLL